VIRAPNSNCRLFCHRRDQFQPVRRTLLSVILQVPYKNPGAAAWHSPGRTCAEVSSLVKTLVWSKTFTNHLGIDSLLQHETCMKRSQIMKPEMREPRFLTSLANAGVTAPRSTGLADG